MIDPILVFGIPVDFILFALTLLGVALFHHRTLQVALTGLAAIVIYKLVFTGFKDGTGLAGLGHHMAHEWVTLANLFLLLMGFALLSRHFEESRIPDAMPALLPDDWKGGVVLLVLVFVLSSFLDNIAAALIGGTVARHVFRGNVHIGYLAAIVAASNAGGAGSVVGDTTTTMMWIAGVSPLAVVEAYIAAVAAMLVFAVPASIQQQRFSPIQKDPSKSVMIDPARVLIVAAILIAALAANIIANVKFPALLDTMPVLGIAVWAIILLTAAWRAPDWKVMPETFKGTIFLLALVTAASLMPVEKLPAASWPTTLGLGFVSAVFDNIPLTALALKQGGYDWGYLAYAVGFGGSMIWFGSSAGVALSNMYPEAKSVGRWVSQGWPVAAAYVIGFFVMLAVLGWHPDRPH
ncbi:citrate transporter [Bradyrhizobium sp. CCBAU 051011]|uniref:citrate transporter n=1 Tax=Bradyrhizobium sp. CCBAU 051011 TaxID=858422 RepID=UPI0013738FC6|nr:citrate transporter [Bradyrhizobium sp. CCBAU 051011]QHO76534.1 citrate transporter [Bradyrhizobium sp. CCBAU 051011]